MARIVCFATGLPATSIRAKDVVETLKLFMRTVYSAPVGCFVPSS
jgi:hypothetical protein